MKFDIVNPDYYYGDSSVMLDMQWHNPDVTMSLSRQTEAPRHNNVFRDENHKEYNEGEFVPGQVYYRYHDYRTLADGEDGQPFYFADIVEPFNTVLQIVGTIGKHLIVQDQFPDDDVHLGHVPHYRITHSDAIEIMSSLDINNGRFRGRFKFTRRGNTYSLGMA